MTSFYHVGFTVPDLEAAMRDLTATVHVTWGDPQRSQVAGVDYRIVLTDGGSPFIELIEAPSGGPWGDTSQPRFHHLGYWTSDLLTAQARLNEGGFTEVFSGLPHKRQYTYHRMASLGTHIEMVDASIQEPFLQAWHPGGPSLPVIEEHRP
ncbi:VOC family protein [Streptomyces sp. NPDC001941]|uniref:VOC family protein n=1 Tax=Streptomyces sp. NPDC001941 TaxID=3154659 RepID=UPI0033281780